MCTSRPTSLTVSHGLVRSAMRCLGIARNGDRQSKCSCRFTQCCPSGSTTASACSPCTNGNAAAMRLKWYRSLRKIPSASPSPSPRCRALLYLEDARLGCPRDLGKLNGGLTPSALDQSRATPEWPTPIASDRTGCPFREDPRRSSMGQETEYQRHSTASLLRGESPEGRWCRHLP